MVVSLSRAWEQLSAVRADIRGLYTKPMEPSRLASILHAVAPRRPAEADEPTLVP